MSADELAQFQEMGPVDYLVLEWPSGTQPSGEAAPLIADLHDRGIIRVLDVAFLTKDAAGNVTALDLADFGEAFAAFDGASSGLMDHSDIREAGEVLEPGASAAVLVWENTWAAPVAVALRKSGGQMVASGRIPVQQLLATLDALEAETV